MTLRRSAPTFLTWTFATWTVVTWDCRHTVVTWIFVSH